MKQHPNFTGTIQDDKQKNIGSIAVWFNAYQSSGAAPVLIGVVSIDGKNCRVALWVDKGGSSCSIE